MRYGKFSLIFLRVDGDFESAGAETGIESPPMKFESDYVACIPEN
jgi:hypothetical protein